MKEHPLIEKLQARKNRHMQRSLLVRALFVIIGFLITFVGILLLVLPGPAFIVLPLGLGFLALEFVWAEKILIKVILKAEKVKQKIFKKL